MEIRLITLGLFVVLLLPASLRENGLTWTVFAISIFLITIGRRIGSAAKQQTLKESQQNSEMLLLGRDQKRHQRMLKALIRTYQ